MKENTVIKRLFTCFKSEKQNLAVYTSMPAISDSRELKERQRRHQRKRHLKIKLHFICATSRLFRPLEQKIANYPGTKLVRVTFELTKRMKNSRSRSRSSHNLEFGHFTLLFCRGRHRNVPKFKTHVQSDWFSSLNQLFCGVVVVVAVVVA